MTERFIAASFPDALDAERRSAAAMLLEPWLEQPADKLASYMKEAPFTVGRLRRLAEILDVNATGMANIMEAHRVSVSSRMLSPKLGDDDPVPMWAKKLVMLGLFCGYYRTRTSSPTLRIAKAEWKRIGEEPNLEMRFRNSARMKHDKMSVGAYSQEAKRCWKELWIDAVREFKEVGTPPDPVIKREVYPIATPWDGRVVSAHCRDGFGAKIIQDMSFSRFKRDDAGELVFAGDNRGSVFINCIFPDCAMRCTLAGATFIGCTFTDVRFTGSLEDVTFIDCKGSVSFGRQDGHKIPQLARARFVNTTLNVTQALYDMPDAWLLRSALMSEKFELGVAHPNGPNDDDNPLGLATGDLFADLCELSLDDRIAAFRGVRLVESYIDLPVKFFADALREALPEEDWKAWVALGATDPEKRSDGYLYGTSLMGDALDAQYFPEA